MKTCLKYLFLGLSLVLAISPEITCALPRAYIANSADNTVSVIDTNARTVVDTITVGPNPTHVAINELGTRVYVRNGATVSVIDTSTNSVIANPALPGGVLFLNADGSRLFSHDDWMGNIFTIDTASYSVLATNQIPSPNLLKGIAVNRQGNFAFVTEAVCCAGVLGLDLISNAWTGTLGSTGLGPKALALNRSGTLLYVFNSFENTLGVVNAFTFENIAKIPSVAGTNEIAINPDGNRVYLANEYEKSVTVVDTQTNTVAGTIALDSAPSGLTVNPPDNFLYVTLPNENSVAVIDPATNAVVAKIPVGNNPVSRGVFIAQRLPVTQQVNLAIRARGPTNVRSGATAKINIVVDNYGPGSAANPSVLIETNAPGSSIYATVSEGWTCMQNPAAQKASFVCAAYGNMPVGSRPSIVLSFIAPRSTRSSKLVVISHITSESAESNISNNTDRFSMIVDADRSIKPPIFSPARRANRH